MGEIEQMLAESLDRMVSQVEQLGEAVGSLSDRLAALESSPPSGQQSPGSRALWLAWLVGRLELLEQEPIPRDSAKQEIIVGGLTPACSSCPKSTPMQMDTPADLVSHCQMAGRILETFPRRCAGHPSPQGHDPELRQALENGLRDGMTFSQIAEYFRGGPEK